ncbi:TPA: hypothetical protein ACH3X1_003486 [Trebouxia sp. C0004]
MSTPAEGVGLAPSIPAVSGTEKTAGESFVVPATSLSPPSGCYGFSNTVETVAEAYQEWMHGLAGPHTAIVIMKGKVDTNLVNMDSMSH